MLPGFRFLFAAIVLSMSVLVFGLGAAALLRAAHEEFASIPSRPPVPETVFAQPAEVEKPTLALLRVETSDTEKSLDGGAAATVPAEPIVIAPKPTEAEPGAAANSENSSPDEPAKSEIATMEPPSRRDATAPQAEMRASADTTIAAATQAAPAPSEAGLTAVDQAIVPVQTEGNVVSKTAALDSASVTTEPRSTKAASARPDENAAKKRLEARRAKERRRVAQRARLARQAAQQAADPFAQPVAPVRTR